MRSAAGLGEVLKHGCLPNQLHPYPRLRPGEGAVNSDALGTSFDGSFESLNTPQEGGRFASPVVKHSLAFEFVSRGPALKAARKSPDMVRGCVKWVGAPVFDGLSHVLRLSTPLGPHLPPRFLRPRLCLPRAP